MKFVRQSWLLRVFTLEIVHCGQCFFREVKGASLIHNAAQPTYNSGEIDFSIILKIENGSDFFYDCLDLFLGTTKYYIDILFTGCMISTP